MDFPKILDQAATGADAWLRDFSAAFSLEFVLKLSVVYLFVVWGSLVVWVARDVTNRSASLLFQAFCVLLVLALSPLGVFIYLLIRPQRTTLERYYESELSVEADETSCASCGGIVHEEWKFCPHCDATLREPCAGCGKPVDLTWEFCPGCGKRREEKKEEKQPAEKKAETPAEEAPKK